MYPIPLRSWRRAQHPPAIRSRIGWAVVEGSAIGLWDRQPCNLMNNSPVKMNLLLVCSWRRVQQPPGVRLRMYGVVVVEFAVGARGYECWVLWWALVYRVAFEAKCRETTINCARLETLQAITRFQTGVSWHFRSFKDDVLKIELWVSVWLGPGSLAQIYD